MRQTLSPCLLSLVAVLGLAAAPDARAQMPALGAAGLAMQGVVPLAVSPYARALAEAARADAAIAAFYAARGHAPLWTGPADAGRRAALLAALDGAALHALPAGQGAALRAAFAAVASEAGRGRLEVAMTRAFLAHAQAAAGGVVAPARIHGIRREVARLEAGALLSGLAAAPDPGAFLRALLPASPEYTRLLRARAGLLDRHAAGGWGAPVAVRSLKPGDRGSAVVALRDRLVRMGRMAPTAVAEYGAALTAAVAAFQAAHGIEPDGVAGETTIAEINRSLEDRVGAIAVAMERERWLPADRGARHIWVNLADFSAKILDDGKVTFATRAVIGATLAEKNTPEFSGSMTYMEVNPDWTVPPGIIRRDFLPRLQSNPAALAHLQVIDARGRVVPRSEVNFAAYSARNFPFSLRQPPGATNALGRVKFMFPNPWLIYLHDTPERHLFARDVRAYSAGCVRLADPFEFAYALLAPQEADPRAAFHRALDPGRQARIFLATPVPIHLDYRTAVTGPRGDVGFRRDIYGRDGAILAALAAAGVDPMARGP